jgi:cytochrome b subunit of formate dehydrogenase
MLFGMLIGLTILLSVIVIVNWFPRVGDAWQRNNGDVRSAWFTVGLYVVWIHRLWRWQHRNKVLFWASLGIIFVLHVTGVLLYSIRVHPLLLGQWLILAAVESAVMVFGLDSLTRRFAQHGHVHIDPNELS